MRLLLVEDDPLVRVTLCTGLQASGFTVEFCDSVDEAIHTFDSGNFDTVLTDLRLGARDGVELASYIRNRECPIGTPRTKIVALSGQLLGEAESRQLSTSFDKILTKPIRMKRLVQEILS